MDEELEKKYIFLDKLFNIFNRKRAMCTNCYTKIKPSQLEKQRGFCANCGRGTFYIRYKQRLLHAIILNPIWKYRRGKK